MIHDLSTRIEPKRMDGLVDDERHPRAYHGSKESRQRQIEGKIFDLGPTRARFEFEQARPEHVEGEYDSEAKRRPSAPEGKEERRRAQDVMLNHCALLF